MSNKQTKLNEKEKYYLKRSESIKEKRKLLREQTKSGNEENKRLWFISAILKNKGIKRHEVAAALGVTPQNLSYIFTVQDDCYLDTVEKILNFAGISCKIRFDIEPIAKENKPEPKFRYNFSGNVIIKNEPAFPKFVTGCPKDARLRFLADLITANGQPFTEFLKNVKMYYTTVQKYFENDNIKVSTLCEISEALGREIIWDLNEK